MIDRTFKKPTPLQYDLGVYWLEPYVFVESIVATRLVGDPQVMAMLEEEMQHVLDHEAPWPHYVTRDIYTDDQAGYRRIYRRYAYEQPGYVRVEVWRMPKQGNQFRVAPKDGNTIALKLRALSFHDEQARGALHDDVLYVVLNH